MLLDQQCWWLNMMKIIWFWSLYCLLMTARPGTPFKSCKTWPTHLGTEEGGGSGGGAIWWGLTQHIFKLCWTKRVLSQTLLHMTIWQYKPMMQIIGKIVAGGEDPPSARRDWLKWSWRSVMINIAIGETSQNITYCTISTSLVGEVGEDGAGWIKRPFEDRIVTN